MVEFSGTQLFCVQDRGLNTEQVSNNLEARVATGEQGLPMSFESSTVTALFIWLPFGSVLLSQLDCLPPWLYLRSLAILAYTQEAMFSHVAVNVQSFSGACLMCARAFPYYSPSVDLTSCFT